MNLVLHREFGAVHSPLWVGVTPVDAALLEGTVDLHLALGADSGEASGGRATPLVLPAGQQLPSREVVGRGERPGGI
jgi:hypothetical protein